MGDLKKFAPILPTILDNVYNGSAEVFVPVEATLAGYRGYLLELTRSFQSWLVWPEQDIPELLPTLPMIWIKGEPDSEPVIGNTGIGFFPTSFRAVGPEKARVDEWLATLDLHTRSYGEFAVSELLAVYPTIATRVIPMLEATYAQSKVADVKACLFELIKSLKDEENGKVWMFCCQNVQEPSFSSADGLDAMLASLVPRMAPGPTRRELAFFLGGTAYRLLLDGAGWSVLDSRLVLGLTRPMPSGIAWIRTGQGTEWNRIDQMGFGISPERGEAFHNFLGQFSSQGYTTRTIKDVMTDPFASAYPLLAGLAGYPKGKQPKGLATNAGGQLWKLSTRMATKGELNFWWLK